MSESEEERRLRKEKKREAARRAAEKEAADAKTTETAATKETEEERRIRKEKKRAQREAAKKQAEAEAEATATSAATAVATSKGKDEEKAVRREKRAAAAVAAAAEDDRKNASPPHHHHHHNEEGEATDTAVEPTAAVKKKTKLPTEDADAALLSAIAAENSAVTAAAAPADTRANRRSNDNNAIATAAADGAAPRAETEEERAARKQAEREERRRLRHAAKAAAAAASAAADGATSISEDAASANSAREKKSAGTASPAAGPSPTTAFDPSELQRQAYRAQFHKDLARATALRRLVDFDGSGGVVLDLAPQTAYDLYIRDFGQSGREQAAVQAPRVEERLDAATQAERGRLRTRGAQAPEDLGLCPEEAAEQQFLQMRRSALQRGAAAAGDGATAEDNNDDDAANGGGAARSGTKKTARAVDAALLERFLTSTLPLMSAVLDENNAATTGAAATAAAATTAGSGSDGKSKGSTAFSSSYTAFCWRGTRNRPLVHVMLNPSNSRQLIALHGPREESGPSPVLDTYLSVLLLWNVHDTTTPERVLVSFSSVTCVCVSPSRPYLLYGGTEDGNVCVWSLREPDRLHLAAGRFERVVFHLPSYSTSWQADGHRAPVRQVRVSGYNAKSSATSRKEEHEQLASMDEQGVMCFWVVSDNERAGRGIQGVDNDYGQHPFTSVNLHLAKSASAAAAADINEGGADMTVAYGAGVAASFDFAPQDAAQYVLTAPHGVMRRSRFGGIAVPSLYSPAQASYCDLNGGKTTSTAAAPSTDSNNVNGVAKTVVVVVPCCVQYSTLDPRWFVAGYEDGTLRLFLQDEATPRLTVEVGYHPILAVRCSGTTPWVVWALDESGTVHMIDFAHHGRQTPRLSYALAQPDTGVCTCIDVSSKDEKVDQRVLVAGFEKGMVQLHTLDTEKLRIANSERDEKWI